MGIDGTILKLPQDASIPLMVSIMSMERFRTWVENDDTDALSVASSPMSSRRRFLRRCGWVAFSGAAMLLCAGCWEKEGEIPPIRIPDDQPTIPDAVRAALEIPEIERPTILLLPGTYTLDETLVISESLFLRGTNPDRCIIECDQSVVLHFDTTARAGIEQLTIRSLSRRPPIDNQPDQAPEGCIMVTRGTPRVHRCVISSGMGNGITLYGVGTNIGCNQCRIENVGSKGIFIAEYATGMFSIVEVSGSAYAGILTTTNAHPQFDYCVIRHGRGNGIDVRSEARGVFSRCRIDANGYSGVEISDRGNPTIDSSEITNNGQWGVHGSNLARGVFNQCVILDNAHGQTSVDISSAVGIHFQDCITDPSQWKKK